MLDGNKKIEIKNSLIIIPAILLLAVYFIADFLNDKQLVIAGIYVAIVGVGIFLCAKKTTFYETIYSLIVLLFLGEIMKNCVPHLKNLQWVYVTLTRAFKFPAGSYGKLLLSTPYIYFYLVGLLLLAICKFAPNLGQSNALKNVFNTLGIYSLWATVSYMCALCFAKYDLIENAIFVVFMVGAFWNAYTKGTVAAADIVKAILLVVEIAVYILLFPKQYEAFIGNIQSAEGITWIYSIGLLVICVLCILSDKVIQDIIIGYAILGTNIMYLYGMLQQVWISPGIMLLFHVGAITFFYVVKNLFAIDSDYQRKRNIKVLLVVSYMMAFLLTTFIANSFNKSTTMLCIGLVFALVYFGNFIVVKGTLYGTVIYGAIPWIMLEITLNSLGKMNSSLFAAILFTILFWCACSVALSWKDTVNIKAIAFEKTKSETIINGLSGIAYFLTALVLFV